MILCVIQKVILFVWINSEKMAGELSDCLFGAVFVQNAEKKEIRRKDNLYT